MQLDSSAILSNYAEFYAFGKTLNELHSKLLQVNTSKFKRTQEWHSTGVK